MEVVKIRVNKTNSKMVNGKLFITKDKAYKLNPSQFEKHVKLQNKLPRVGEMIEYSGEYSRK
jgi:predicted metallo-beta-lactamase superfamily hydrolase